MSCSLKQGVITEIRCLKMTLNKGNNKKYIYNNKGKAAGNDYSRKNKTKWNKGNMNVQKRYQTRENVKDCTPEVTPALLLRRN